MNAVENIRAALADARTGPWIGAGPSFGAPHPAYLNSVVEDVDHDDAATICRDTETGDARYIAACNPAAMAEVLAHIDAQAAEIERLEADAADHLAELRAYELTVANLREQLAQQAPQVAHPDNLEQIIDDYVDDYVMEGDDGTHWPTESEKCLLKDAVMGLLADHEWNSAWGKIVEGSKQAPQVPMTLDSVIELVKECGLDWHRGFVPLFADDPTNRFAVLVEAVEAHHGIKEQP